MKKIIGISIVVLSCNMAISQESLPVQNKNGVDIMPVQGEFALGLDAAPFLRYVGDIFGRTASNGALGNNDNYFDDYFGTNTIYGKYMYTSNTAIRANFSLTDKKYTYKYNVFDDTKNSPDSTVTDKGIREESGFNIGVGYEFRRGKTRLKGIYGGEVLFMRRQNKAHFEYGNTLVSSNMTPTSSNFNGNGSNSFGSSNLAERKISDVQSRELGIALRAFVGVEYYFAPKMCIGAEFGQALSYTANKESKFTTEFFDPTATNEDGSIGAIRTNETITAGEKYFGITPDNFNGALYLMFYF